MFIIINPRSVLLKPRSVFHKQIPGSEPIEDGSIAGEHTESISKAV
ncbi:MAG: hypothetical protein ACI38Y_04485 [Candidatus Methanomethylophilaceae archaeon]